MATLTDEEILAGIRAEARELAPHVDPAVLRRDAHIAEVGIDSVQMLELVARVENRFGVTLPDYDLAAIESVGDLIGIIGRARAEAS
ncbi:phosphopantetheine-binding protein [Amycolatopsis pigmentata]|uniref:Phosphopantetheine-binding protein n=1 Tax=Amycolatopsis pigmentata TaxID=450801 RepID=A0ABW5FME4_9PSEU